MKIPRYWFRATERVADHRGHGFHLAVWGWSDRSRAEAEQRARERLASIAQRVQQGADLPSRYAYGERPLREEIIREVPGRDGKVAAVATRNSYGSLVLNTRDLMFVDVDSTEAPRTGLLARLFGKTSPDQQAALPDGLATVLESLRGSFRVYRTAAGWRVCATDRACEPGSAEAVEAMERMGADPAFLQLCRIQETFRARLTPKPWRCRAGRPPGQYPREDPKDSARFARWLEQYERACEPKATCRFVQAVGPERVAQELRPMLELHDSLTRATSRLPLA
jgi:hypothetical protein